MPGGLPTDHRLPWLEGLGSALQALAPLTPTQRLPWLSAQARLQGMRTESGHPLSFLERDGVSDYEAHIFSCGEVPTRVQGPGARHDLYNALTWLRWPRTKARLNALHVQVRAQATPVEGRGSQRDAATLFDENGVVWIGQHSGLESALRAFDWPTVFGTHRQRLRERVRVAVFGHALLHKLETPYKAITAHGITLSLPITTPQADIDRALADRLTPEALDARHFCPLPVMGLPGWSADNEDPRFYDDPQVFRRGRLRQPRAIIEPPT